MAGFLKKVAQPLQKLKKDFTSEGRKIFNAIRAYVLMYLILFFITLVLAVIIYYMSNYTPGTFQATNETFRTAGQFVLNVSFYQSLENSITGSFSSIIHTMRHNIVFNIQFRTLAVLIAVLATLLMGLSMLTGEQKITVKEFASDILVIYGSVGILLSQNVIEYIDFFYNFILSIANGLMEQATHALFNITDFKYQDSTPSQNIYAPLDIVSSMIFDSTVASRIKIKIAALIYSDYIVYVPIVLIILLNAWVLTLNVFIAMMIAKITIMIALQVLPFFLLFSSINDVKIKFTKKGKSQSFLWALVNIGIIKPLIYLSLMSIMSSLLFYILVLQNIENMLNFSVYVPSNPIDWLTSIPIIGDFLRIILVRNFPTTAGLDRVNMSQNILFLIFGMIIFKKAFETLTNLVQAISFDPKEGKQITNLFGGGDKGGSLYDDKNFVGKMVNPVVNQVKHWAKKYSTGYDDKKGSTNINDSMFKGFKNQRNEAKKAYNYWTFSASKPQNIIEKWRTSGVKKFGSKVGNFFKKSLDQMFNKNKPSTFVDRNKQAMDERDALDERQKSQAEKNKKNKPSILSADNNETIDAFKQKKS